jgi:hypothetical protein
MGCDFYTYYVVYIEYKSNGEVKIKKYEIEDTRERHYFWDDPDWDEDFESRTDYYERVNIIHERQVEEALAKYKTAHLYKDNKWLCIPDAVEKYRVILNKYGIIEDSVTQIWKQGDFHYR